MKNVVKKLFTGFIKCLFQEMLGKEINNYKLTKKLGEGGYGSVYKVENIQDKNEYIFLCNINVT